jgi:hypothetical protein
MNKLIYKGPLNSLSFGNVSYNLLKAMFKKDMDVAFFPIGKIDVSSFGEEQGDFKQWLEEAGKQRYAKLDRDVPTLQMWHLNGSEHRVSSRQILYTFYELDKPTQAVLYQIYFKVRDMAI